MGSVPAAASPPAAASSSWAPRPPRRLLLLLLRPSWALRQRPLSLLGPRLGPLGWELVLGISVGTSIRSTRSRTTVLDTSSAKRRSACPDPAELGRGPPGRWRGWI